jgi:hypothetical protein
LRAYSLLCQGCKRSRPCDYVPLEAELRQIEARFRRIEDRRVMAGTENTMTWRYDMTPEQKEQERLRIQAGIQCPECSGVRVLQVTAPYPFQCQECDTRWGRGVQ